MSRPSSPEHPPEDLWSSILDSVASKRSTPSKQVLLLGGPSSGRSTIASALLQKQNQVDNDSHDFALGYDWADIRDDADEDTLARLSVYIVPSSAPTHLKLVPHFLPPLQSLQHTLAIIVLDWTRPWTFLDQLELWLNWIETWSKVDGSRELQILREESKEKLQYHFQHYTEPVSASETLPTSNASLDSTILPLGPGTLTRNSAGLPVVVVCSKADLIDEEPDLVRGGANIMVKGKGGEWEERTDAIMQVLRTVCLNYGAALFYTTRQPPTQLALRQYVLHMLFMSDSISLSTDGSSSRNPFTFNHKPNAIDRDRILIPSGWDSWGKIGVLREGFDARSWCEAWNEDMDRDGNTSQDGDGACSLYKKLVGTIDNQKVSNIPPLLLPTPEQNFLKDHWEENARRPDRDPRNTFRDPNEVHGINASSGVVGPMGSVSFQMPTVERVLGVMEGEAPGNGNKILRRDTVSRPAALGIPSASALRSPGSPAFGSPPGSANGAVQHETLQNFFQSLLQTNSRTKPMPGTPTAGGNAAANPSGEAG